MTLWMKDKKVSQWRGIPDQVWSPLLIDSILDESFAAGYTLIAWTVKRYNLTDTLSAPTFYSITGSTYSDTFSNLEKYLTMSPKYDLDGSFASPITEGRFAYTLNTYMYEYYWQGMTLEVGGQIVDSILDAQFEPYGHPEIIGGDTRLRLDAVFDYISSLNPYYGSWTLEGGQTSFVLSERFEAAFLDANIIRSMSLSSKFNAFTLFSNFYYPMKFVKPAFYGSMRLTRPAGVLYYEQDTVNTNSGSLSTTSTDTILKYRKVI